MSAPRAVLFDLFHTLISLRRDSALGPPTWEGLGVPKDDWLDAFYRDRAGRRFGGPSDPVEALQLVVNDLPHEVSRERLEQTARSRAERLHEAMTTVNPAFVEALHRLRARGTRLALVSNVCSEETGAWPESPLAPLFDATVFSCDVGLAKPDPAIYRMALDRIGVTAGEAVFVGDGGSEELRGAREAGLRTVLVTWSAATVWPETLPEKRRHADHEIHDVTTLDAVLGGAA